jgi:small subunit ribosomal protein S24e
MEIEINEKKNNPLFKRTEVYFTVVHPNEATPNRAIIQSELADALNANKDHIIIDRIHSGFGVQKTKGYAKVYTSRTYAESIERKHQLERNKASSSQPKKGEKGPTAQKQPAEKSPEESSDESNKEGPSEGKNMEAET